MTTLQNIIFPDPEICTEIDLYVRLNDLAALDRPTGLLRLAPGGTADFGTYFNALSIGKWHRFCTLDGVTLEAGARDAAVGALWDALAPRIAADLPLQGVGHLDIAASNAGLRVSGTGFAAFEIALEDQTPARTALASAPQPKPMITPDTEADLRAQLAALLDGGAA